MGYNNFNGSGYWKPHTCVMSILHCCNILAMSINCHIMLMRKLYYLTQISKYVCLLNVTSLSTVFAACTIRTIMNAMHIIDIIPCVCVIFRGRAQQYTLSAKTYVWYKYLNVCYYLDINTLLIPYDPKYYWNSNQNVMMVVVKWYCCFYKI